MKVWITNDGTEIPYKELKDSHLLNILKWIERKTKDGTVRLVGYCGFGDDMGDNCCDVEEVSESDLKKYLDYYGLRKEAKKRGLLNLQQPKGER